MKKKYYYPRLTLLFNILDANTKLGITPSLITIDDKNVNWVYDNNNYIILYSELSNVDNISIKILADGYISIEAQYSFNQLNNSTIYMVAPVGLFDFRFYKNRVWDVFRDPAFPEVNVLLKITVNTYPFKDTSYNLVTELELSNGNYIGLLNRCKFTELDITNPLENSVRSAILQSNAILNSGVATDDLYIVATALFNSSGEFIQYIGDYGVLWGLGKEGFLFTDYSAKERGTFFFMLGSWQIGDVLQYIPEYTIVTSLEIIENYFKL